jgi:uncharacterized protein YlaI
MCRECSMHVDTRNAYRVSMGKPEGKKPLRKPRNKCEDNFKVDLR